MLKPAEATGRALALLTYAHASLAADGDGGWDGLPAPELLAVLGGGVDESEGEVDWRAIAMAGAMVGHVLLDLIPEKLYDAAEEAMESFLVARDAAEGRGSGAGEGYKVTISRRVTGTDLLQALSLQIAAAP